MADRQGLASPQLRSFAVINIPSHRRSSARLTAVTKGLAFLLAVTTNLCSG